MLWIAIAMPAKRGGGGKNCAQELRRIARRIIAPPNCALTERHAHRRVVHRRHEGGEALGEVVERDRHRRQRAHLLELRLLLHLRGGDRRVAVGERFGVLRARGHVAELDAHLARRSAVRAAGGGAARRRRAAVAHALVHEQLEHHAEEHAGEEARRRGRGGAARPERLLDLGLRLHEDLDEGDVEHHARRDRERHRQDHALLHRGEDLRHEGDRAADARREPGAERDDDRRVDVGGAPGGEAAPLCHGEALSGQEDDEVQGARRPSQRRARRS